MLRQAMDDAIATESEKPIESTSLESEHMGVTYGAVDSAIQQPARDDSDAEDYIEVDDEDDDENDSWDEDDEESQESERRSVLQDFISRIKNCIWVIANVENLWDDPPDPQTRRLSQLIVLFWFVVLACSYATERSTFKLLVDRAGCFRLFAVGMVTAVHALLLGLFMFIASLVKRGQESSKIKLGISLVDVGFMALLDTVALILMFLSGYHVPPSLTVILIQFTLPLTAFLTQFVHPDGRWNCFSTASAPTDQASLDTTSYTNGSAGAPPNSARQGDRLHPYGETAVESQPLFQTIGNVGEPIDCMGGLSRTHVWGVTIIGSAVLLALIPAFYSIIDPSVFLYADPIPIRTAINTLVYVSSCIPAAASQLYKEHTFLRYRQPVNMNYLNLLLSVFQFMFAAIVAPLVFGLQGLGSGRKWAMLYPSSQFGENMMDGLKCFFWGLSDKDQERKYAEGSYCDFCLGLTIVHALSIIFLGFAVNQIVCAGATKVMYRGMSAGIILAAVTMHTYDMRITDFNYGALVDGLNLISVVLLILGSEIYHRVGLRDATFDTKYPDVQFEYDDG